MGMKYGFDAMEGEGATESSSSNQPTPAENTQSIQEATIANLSTEAAQAHGPGLSPSLTFPTQLPPLNEDAWGFADSADGIIYHAFGDVVDHFDFPLVVEVVPNDGESALFEWVTHDDLMDVEFAPTRQAPRIGNQAEGWWATLGKLKRGRGRVVNVFQNVKVAWVEEWDEETEQAILAERAGTDVVALARVDGPQ